MTKAELINSLHLVTGIPKTRVDGILDHLGYIMRNELLAGNEVPLPGIGKLVAKETKARKGKNPKTGEEIDIPAGRRVSLKIGKSLKEALKG